MRTCESYAVDANEKDTHYQRLTSSPRSYTQSCGKWERLRTASTASTSWQFTVKRSAALHEPAAQINLLPCPYNKQHDITAAGKLTIAEVSPSSKLNGVSLARQESWTVATSSGCTFLATTQSQQTKVPTNCRKQKSLYSTQTLFVHSQRTCANTANNTKMSASHASCKATALSARQVDNCKQAFFLFDSDGTGTIATEALSSVLQFLGHKPTADDVKQVAAAADPTGSGTIDFVGFLRSVAQPKTLAVPIHRAVTLTSATTTGQWMHAPSSTFVFAYLQDSWPDDVKASVAAAFNDALAMSETIKQSVLKTSGQEVVNGLYLLDQPAMTLAMNSIDGMGMTTAKQGGNSGDGTAASINAEFFAGVLAGLGGDIAPILGYLNDTMAGLQATTQSTKVTETFGTVMAMVSLMPILNVPVTTFSYIFSSKETSTWFTKTNCHSHEHYSYSYKYTNAVYNYVKPSR